MYYAKKVVQRKRGKRRVGADIRFSIQGTPSLFKKLTESTQERKLKWIRNSMGR